MADAKSAVAPAAEDIRKKCAQTGVNLKRKKRYYRNGRYYITKAAFQTKAKTEKAAAATAVAASPKEEQK